MDMPMPAANNHGFSLLGQKSLTFSHIPMFMPPHQAQVFLEVTLSGSGGQDSTEIYLKDMQSTGTTNYVLLSDPIVLQNLAPHATQPIRSFTGKLYRGWPFNTPNTAPLLADNVTVNVTRSIYWEKIAIGKPFPDLTYLAFATPEANYLVHKLVQPADLNTAPKPPGFVQILSAQLKPEHLRGIEKLTIPGIADNYANRLQAGKTVNGEAGLERVEILTKAELIYDPDHLTM
jgi:hypothetical protein